MKIEVKYKGGHSLFVYETKSKSGYVSYQVPDDSSGKRKLWTFSDLDKASNKAKQIAEGKAAGQQSVLALAPMQREIDAALNALKPSGTPLDRAANIVADALKLVPAEDIVAACRHWRDNGPGKPFAPKLTSEALKEFQTRREGKVSRRRHNTMTSYLKTFGAKFGERMLHDITSVEIADFAGAKKWDRSTRNAWLNAISQVYTDSVQRGYCRSNIADAKSIKREKSRGTDPEIFTPQQARAVLNRIGDELKAGLSLWFFGGLRLAEVARLVWPQVDAGLASGSIHLRADQSKTGQPRTIPILPNLKLWLLKYRKPSGTVMPLKWTTILGLSHLPRHITRHTKVAWTGNSPRHSFATYHLKLHGDPGLTTRVMGNSLGMLQRHYASRSDAVTRKTAEAWFDITPDDNVEIKMPESEAAVA